MNAAADDRAGLTQVGRAYFVGRLGGREAFWADARCARAMKLPFATRPLFALASVDWIRAASLDVIGVVPVLGGLDIWRS